MRRIAMLAAAVFLSITGEAAAVTNTVAYSARIAMSSAPAPGAPAWLAYQWAQRAGTYPEGQQPDAVSRFTIFFAKDIASNAQYFPTCTQDALDGQDSVPAACQAAVVGNGTATMYAGSPGQPASSSVQEDLNVELVNGTPAGQQWLLFLKSTDSAPVLIRRALPGTVIGAADPYGFAVRFDVPADLQTQLGLTVSIARLAVNIPQAPRVITVGEVPYSISFLAIGACSGSIPVRHVTEFEQNGYGGILLAAESTAPCQIGPGFADYPSEPPFPDYPPYGGYPTYPPYPGYPPYPPYPPGPNPGGGGDDGSGGSGADGGGGGSPPSGPGEPPAGTSSGNGARGPNRPPPPRISGASGTRSTTAGADGSFTLKGVTVACPADAGSACAVTGDAVAGAGAAKVRKTVILAKVGFRLAPGRSSAVKMRLTKAGKRLLAKKRQLRLTVHLRIREANGSDAKRTVKALVKARKHAKRS